MINGIRVAGAAVNTGLGGVDTRIVPIAEATLRGELGVNELAPSGATGEHAMSANKGGEGDFLVRAKYEILLLSDVVSEGVPGDGLEEAGPGLVEDSDSIDGDEGRASGGRRVEQLGTARVISAFATSAGVGETISEVIQAIGNGPGWWRDPRSPIGAPFGLFWVSLSPADIIRRENFSIRAKPVPDVVPEVDARLRGAAIVVDLDGSKVV